MEQLILKKKPRQEVRSSTVIKVDQEAANILEDFAVMSAYSKYKIASEMIKFAAKYTEIIEEEMV